MRWPGRTIWDTKIQGVCGLISARGNDETAVFFSATFAQVTLSPPRIIINPNRTFSIEPAIKAHGRFALTVMPESSKAQVLQLIRLRRRQPNKAALAGFAVREDHHAIPFIDNGLETLFCEVESSADSGDRKIYIARVLEARRSPSQSERPLLFADVSQSSLPLPTLRKRLRAGLAISGLLDVAKLMLYKLKPPPTADIALNTYEQAGSTDQEIAEITRFGTLDRSRNLVPPQTPVILRKRIGVCVVGTGWGSFHCQLLRKANPAAQLFVCGRDINKTRRVAKAFKATDVFPELAAAARDSRVQAFIVAIPPDLHRWAAEIIAAAGKHALVEKPIATTLLDAESMIQTAKQAATILMIAEDMHFRPAIREAWKLIMEGAIGEPLYFLSHAATVRGTKRGSGGMLMDLGVHYVRALRLLMGEPDFVVASKAMQTNTKIAGEDNIQLMLSSEAGWQAHMLFSWVSQRGNLPDIIVAGDKGTLHLWPGAPYIDLYPANPTLINRALSFVRPYSLQEKLRRPRFGRIRTRLQEREGSGYLGEVREFLAAIIEGRLPVSPPEDAKKDLAIVLRSYEALNSESKISTGR